MAKTLVFVAAGMLLLLVWLVAPWEDTAVVETHTTTHRFTDLRLTCVEFQWSTPKTKQVATPQLVCQSDLTLINTLIAAAYLAEIAPAPSPNLLPPVERKN